MISRPLLAEAGVSPVSWIARRGVYGGFRIQHVYSAKEHHKRGPSVVSAASIFQILAYSKVTDNWQT